MGHRISVSLPSEHDGNGRRGPASRLHGDCAAVRSGCRPRPWVTAERVPCRRSVHSPERTIGCRRARKVWLFGHLIMSIWRIPADHVTNRDGFGPSWAWVHAARHRVRASGPPRAWCRVPCSEYRAAWPPDIAVLSPALGTVTHRSAGSRHAPFGSEHRDAWLRAAVFPTRAAMWTARAASWPPSAPMPSFRATDAVWSQEAAS